MKKIIIIMLIILNFRSESQVLDLNKVIINDDGKFWIPLQIEINNTQVYTMTYIYHIRNYIKTHYKLNSKEENKLLYQILSNEKKIVISNFPPCMKDALLFELQFEPFEFDFWDNLYFSQVKQIEKKGKKYLLNYYCTRRQSLFYRFKGHKHVHSKDVYNLYLALYKFGLLIDMPIMAEWATIIDDVPKYIKNEEEDKKSRKEWQEFDKKIEKKMKKLKKK